MYSDKVPPSPSQQYPPSPAVSSPSSHLTSPLLPSTSDSTWEPSSSSPYLRTRPPRWFARTNTWVLISALLFLVLLFLGGSAAHPQVRQYALDKVADAVAAKNHAALLREGGGYRGKGGAGWWDEEQWERDVRAGRKANATITILVNPFSNMYLSLLPTLSNLEERFNRRLGYPIQLLTDGELPSEEIRNRTEWVTKGKARWSLVTPEQGWGPPSWVSKADIESGYKKVPGFGIGYKNMCRFFSRFHHNHPALINYEWIWRLDEGIEFFCELVRSRYTNIDNEALFVVPSLWRHFVLWLGKARRENPAWFPKGADPGFVQNEQGGYNLRMYYNNFEIVHRSFLESEAYQSYTSYLDHAKGFYTERWGDAPVRTIGLSYLVPSHKIHSFSNLTGYHHDTPPFECPSEPWCYCNPHKSRQNAFSEWW
ncbi:hypothetical protein JCM8547_007663 [Rhodosporidiobolus lusitaniae]